MQITATQLKSNLGKYLEKAATETIYVTQYGRRVAKITAADAGRDLVDELFGSLPSTMTIEEALDGRLLCA